MPLETVPLRFDDADAFVQKVRDFMRDESSFNALLDGKETSDTLIEFSAELALDDWNSTPPHFWKPSRSTAASAPVAARAALSSSRSTTPKEAATSTGKAANSRPDPVSSSG